MTLRELITTNIQLRREQLLDEVFDDGTHLTNMQIDEAIIWPLIKAHIATKCTIHYLACYLNTYIIKPAAYYLPRSRIPDLIHEILYTR